MRRCSITGLKPLVASRYFDNSWKLCSDDTHILQISVVNEYVYAVVSCLQHLAGLLTVLISCAVGVESWGKAHSHPGNRCASWIVFLLDWRCFKWNSFDIGRQSQVQASFLCGQIAKWRTHFMSIRNCFENLSGQYIECGRAEHSTLGCPSLYPLSIVRYKYRLDDMVGCKAPP